MLQEEKMSKKYSQGVYITDRLVLKIDSNMFIEHIIMHKKARH